MFGSETYATLRRLAWLLHARDVELKLRNLGDAVAKANFNPNEPRVPAGNPDGGQWAGGGSSSPGSSSSILSDANPDPIIPGAQYAQTQVTVHTSALTGIESIDDTTTKLAHTLACILDGIEILPDTTPQKYGMIIHSLFANAVRFGGFEGIGSEDVETTFSIEPDARYGAKGSIRTDVVLRNAAGDIVAIYDVMTGKEPSGREGYAKFVKRPEPLQTFQFLRCISYMESRASILSPAKGSCGWLLFGNGIRYCHSFRMLLKRRTTPVSTLPCAKSLCCPTARLARSPNGKRRSTRKVSRFASPQAGRSMK